VHTGNRTRLSARDLPFCINVHIPPVQIARRVTDESALDAILQAGRYQGIELDVHLTDEWRVEAGRGQPLHPPLGDFLRIVDEHRRTGTGGERLRTMLEVRAEHVDDTASDRLLAHCDRFKGELDIRFVSYSPGVVNALYHANATREEPYVIQIYMQEDDVRNHVQWSKRHYLGLPTEIGYHLRLHAFPAAQRPTYEEAAATGRRITTTGWNPLYRGWRDHDLSEVWNIRRSG
jgi:hypothetical protein